MNETKGNYDRDGSRIDVERQLSKIAAEVIADLQAIKDTLSGPDSGLANAWDEICVQRQSEEAHSWVAYDETVRHCIMGRLRRLPENLRSRVCRSFTSTAHEDGSEYDQDELADYIADEIIYPLAETHSNSRIERFLAEHA